MLGQLMRSRGLYTTGDIPFPNIDEYLVGIDRHLPSHAEAPEDPRPEPATLMDAAMQRAAMQSLGLTLGITRTMGQESGIPAPRIPYPVPLVSGRAPPKLPFSLKEAFPQSPVAMSSRAPAELPSQAKPASLAAPPVGVQAQPLVFRARPDTALGRRLAQGFVKTTTNKYVHFGNQRKVSHTQTQ